MTNPRHAALTALYTLLLSVGAAAPIAASYTGPVGARPAGYRAPVSTDAPAADGWGDRPLRADR